MKTLPVLSLLLALLAPPALAEEAPLLAAKVSSGALPPQAQRLPDEPRKVVVDAATGREPGKQGGTLRMLMAEQNDLRMMTVYGYARLVGFNRDLELEPDILAGYENEGNKVFTLHIRPGHRWSDGSPFTAEDFRYQWEDVIVSPEMARGGIDPALYAGGELPKFEVVDPLTVRYTWTTPNPMFLTALAGARPLDVYSASAYLKKFHAKYADAQALDAMVKAEKVKDWQSLQIRKARSYRPENPDLPTLQPWMNTTRPPSERFVFDRNPYYHKIDQNGVQLPYIDQVVMSIAEGSIIPAKVGSGESDLQERYLRFSDYTFLKEGEKRNGYSVRLWTVGKGSAVALYPNLNSVDPDWRAVFRDVRFRRALSLGIDRSEINEALFSGLAQVSANTVIPGSPLWREELATAYAGFDLDQANALLDEIGLKRGPGGLRQFPNGKPLNLIVETTGESTMETDVLELVRDSWSKLGVKLLTRTSQRDIFRARIGAGEIMMSVWAGVDNGAPTPDWNPKEFVPADPYNLQWPAWGNYVFTQGKAGEKIDDPKAARLVELQAEWMLASDEDAKRRIWDEILDIQADQVFSIGIVTATLVPVVVSDRLHNVPDEGISSFEPYAYFGVYEMDAFWMDGK
jgi:peptide/nickel transport system substrate-binding protein